MLTVFGQTAFGQFWCFSVLDKFCCCCCSWLLPVVACCCLLVLPVGVACWWCLLVVLVGVACWWCLLVVLVGAWLLLLFVCVVGVFKIWASPPDLPPPDCPSSGVMADNGQSDCGQPSLASPFWRPSLAKPTLASVSVCFVCVLCVCVLCVFCVCFVWRGCWFHGFRVGVSRFWFGHVRCPRNRPSHGPPNISLFFSLSLRKISSFLPSLGVFSLIFFFWTPSR